MTVEIIQGDCLDILRAWPDNSMDSCVCDPPYELGFMGKKWDASGIAYNVDLWKQVLRVLKPGAHLLAFGGTRTSHRMVCAIEDAGFEIRDQIAWTFGVGFPKSLNVSRAIDQHLCTLPGRHFLSVVPTGDDAQPGDHVCPRTPEGEDLSGFGTAIKPAWEPVCVARKLLSEGTVAANVLKHGTGGLNVDGCRIETDDDLNGGAYAVQGNRTISGSMSASGMNVPGKTTGKEFVQPLGRFPANIVHDGSDEVIALFPDTGKSTGGQASLGAFRNGDIFGKGRDERQKMDPGFGDSGSAARFFYTAKTSSAERAEYNEHPTVKPIALMRWLCRLVTPPGGKVLDPFAGSGTTGIAAEMEGFSAVLIEKEASYVAIAKRRLADKSLRRVDEPLRPTKKQDDFGPLFSAGGEA